MSVGGVFLFFILFLPLDCCSLVLVRGCRPVLVTLVVGHILEDVVVAGGGLCQLVSGGGVFRL